MSTTSIEIQLIMARLLSIETREATTNTVIEALKQQNLELKQENVAIKKDLDGLMTKVENLEDKVIPGLRKKIRQVKQKIQKDVKYLSGLRSVLSQSLVDRQNIPDLYQKVDDLGRRIDGKTETLERKTSFLERRTGSLEQIRDDLAQSVTWTRLRQPNGGLIIGQWAKMDRVEVYGTTGVMEKTTGCLVPKRKGRYFVGVRLCQDGDGEIGVRMRWDGAVDGQSMVQTGSHGDIQSGVCVFGMDEDEKFWFEAVRWKGGANILWCYVYCWCLSPL